MSHNEHTKKDDFTNEITLKEKEIQNLLFNKINELNKVIDNQNNKIDQMQNSLNRSQFDNNKLNIQIKDLSNQNENSQSKIIELSKLLNDKNETIKQLENSLDLINSKINKEEKDKIQREELNKYSLAKIKIKYDETVSKLQSEINELTLENKNLRNKVRNLHEDISNAKSENESNIINLEHKSKLQNEHNSLLENTLKGQEGQIKDYNIQVMKLKTQNFNLIKEKIQLETTLKKVNSDYQKDSNSVYLSNQKCKLMQSELYTKKEENTKLQEKIDKLYIQIDELKEDIFKAKQLSQVKSFEVEKEKLNNKLNIQKIKELEILYAKVSKEKTELEIANAIEKKNLTDEIENFKIQNISLNKQIEELNIRISNLHSVNERLKQSKDKIKPTNLIKTSRNSKEDSINEALNFFNNQLGNNRYSEEVNNVDIFNSKEFQHQLNMKIKEKDLELERVKQEYELNQNQLLSQIEELKQSENQLNQDIIQYKEIIMSLEEKVEALDNLYKEDKDKIKEEYKKEQIKYEEQIKKIKREKDKLFKLSSRLKIELNRLENNLSLSQSKEEIIQNN